MNSLIAKSKIISSINIKLGMRTVSAYKFMYKNEIKVEFSKIRYLRRLSLCFKPLFILKLKTEIFSFQIIEIESLEIKNADCSAISLSTAIGEINWCRTTRLHYDNRRLYFTRLDIDALSFTQHTATSRARSRRCHIDYVLFHFLLWKRLLQLISSNFLVRTRRIKRDRIWLICFPRYFFLITWCIHLLSIYNLTMAWWSNWQL